MIGQITSTTGEVLGQANRLDLAKWAECGEAEIDAASLLGQPCWCGVDVASTTGLNAIVLVFGNDSTGVKVLCRFFLPEHTDVQEEIYGPVRNIDWSGKGQLTLTRGNRIDYDVIRCAILQYAQTYQIANLFADRWNAGRLIRELEEEGIAGEAIGQTFLHLSEATKYLQKLILAGKLHHGNASVLNLMVENAHVLTDRVGNEKILGIGNISGIKALVNALAAKLAYEAKALAPRATQTSERLTESQSKMAAAFMPLATSMARTFQEEFPAKYDEISSAAMLGLVQAAHSFDASTGVYFGHWARKHIRWRILDEISPRRKSMTPDELRRKIESQGDKNVRLFGLNEAIDEAPEQEVDQADFFEDLTSKLTDRQKQIIEAVYLWNDRLSDVARILDRTRSRLSSLHANCLAAMKRRVVPDAGEAGEAD